MINKSKEAFCVFNDVAVCFSLQHIIVDFALKAGFADVLHLLY